METLPREMLVEIAMKLTDKDVIHMCQIDKNFNSICNDDAFWKLRAETYIKEFANLKKKYFPNGSNYKEIYRMVRSGKPFKTGKYSYGDKLNGTFIRWYNNGDMNAKMYYKNGTLNGLYESWYPIDENDKQQKELHTYHNNGESDGPFYFWYRNGILAEYSIYRNGKKVTGEHWDLDGNKN